VSVCVVKGCSVETSSAIKSSKLGVGYKAHCYQDPFAVTAKSDRKRARSLAASGYRTQTFLLSTCHRKVASCQSMCRRRNNGFFSHGWCCRGVRCSGTIINAHHVQGGSEFGAVPAATDRSRQHRSQSSLGLVSRSIGTIIILGFPASTLVGTLNW
jgi:hypothetical protein